MSSLTRPADVFLSYAHGDEGLKDRLVGALAGLERQGLVKLWHDRKIEAGAEWQSELDEKLNRSDLILLLLSPDFLASDYCRSVELPRALERQERRQSRVIPIILRPCDWQATALAQLEVLPKDGKPVTDWQDETEAFADIAEGTRVAVEAIKQEVLPTIWNVPFRRNPHFTGRRELLQSLRTALGSGRPAAVTQAIHGLGGVGKTQLAVEYAYRHARDYNLVWWIRSEESAALASDYARLAEPLDLPLKAEKDQSLIVRAVRRWLENNKGWLLVFDNVEKPEDLKDYLPQVSNGHIIVTSRNPHWRGVGEALPVEVLPREQAVQLLLRRSGSKETDRDAAAKLAEELGDLPLALEQAAAYVDETGTTLGRYLELLRTHRKQVLTRKGVTQEYPESVATTWEISFRRLEQESPAAAELLNLCAFLAPEAIPLDLIAEGRQHLPERLSQALASPIATDELKAALRRYSLAQVKGDDITLHRLVQAVVRDRMSEDDHGSEVESAVGLLARVFPEQSDDARFWDRCARLHAHAAQVAGQASELGMQSGAAAALFRSIGRYLHSRARFAEAGAFLERALSAAEALSGPTHPDVAEILGDLGVLSLSTGQYAAGETFIRRALGILVSAFGPDHAKIATGRHNLAAALEFQGRYDEAERIYRQALSIRQGRGEVADSAAATTMNNLAEVLVTLGRLDEAESLYRQALEVRRSSYGEMHAETAQSFGNLALLLKRRGRLADAEGLYRRALEIEEKVLGPDHPSTATTTSNLAVLLDAMGNAREAEPLHRRALAVREQRLGAIHPDTAISLNNLGMLLRKQGKCAEAEPLLRRALRILEAALAPDHPIPTRVRGNLAMLLEDAGRSDEAAQLRQRSGVSRK